LIETLGLALWVKRLSRMANGKRQPGLRTARAPSAEFIKDRAVGAVIAFAGGDQAAQHLNDAPMCFHAGDDFLLVTLGQDANLSARSPPIAPKIEQLVDLLDRKAQGSSPFDEAQLMYIALVEDPVTTGVPAGEGDARSEARWCR
jgi:hypothetical protein